MTDHVLITTDLDRTLIFSKRATAQLGGALPADPVEMPGSSNGTQTAGELSLAARDAIAALPGYARLCLATSRNLTRLARLRLPFAVPYAIAANGGVVLVDGKPDRQWAGRIQRELAAVAPAGDVRAVLGGYSGESWLERLSEPDDMCCVAIVDRDGLPADHLAEIERGCSLKGWKATLIGRKLYVFPASFGKEHAVAFIAEQMASFGGQPPRRLAAGDTEHDLAMLEAADVGWVPAGSDLAGLDLAGRAELGGIRVTRLPGHAAAAQITREWLSESAQR